MFTYLCEKFHVNELNSMQRWLNDNSKNGYRIKVINTVSLDSYIMVVTILRWRVADLPKRGEEVRTSIDELPEDPTIDYSADEELKVNTY